MVKYLWTGENFTAYKSASASHMYNYVKQHPWGFPEEDVYVCEHRYLYKYKSFPKIKLRQHTPHHSWTVPSYGPLYRVKNQYSETMYMYFLYECFCRVSKVISAL